MARPAFGRRQPASSFNLKRASVYTDAEARRELATLAPHATACGPVQVCDSATIHIVRDDVRLYAEEPIIPLRLPNCESTINARLSAGGYALQRGRDLAH